MTQNRLPLTIRALLATVVGLLSLGAVPAAVAVEPGAQTAALRAPAAVPVEDVSVSIRQSASFLGAGATMSVTLTVENNTAVTVADGTLTLQSDADALTSRSDLSEWLDHSTESGTEHTVATVPVPALEPGASHTVTPIEVTAETLALPAAGVFPMDALFTSAETVVEARDTVVYSPDAAATPLGVAVVMPITAPPGTSGLLTADALAFYTSPTGVLTKQLDGVIDRPVALGIDPMLIASVRALGSAAPASAIAWLDRLSRATNETFPLQYADADPAVQAQAGIPTLLSPTSLLFGLNPENFAAETPDGDEETPDTTPGDTETPTPDATPTPDVTPLPTLAELTEWQYTTTGVVWPAADTVISTDLPVFAASGATSTIVSSNNVASTESYTPGAAARVGDAALIVSDAAASDALQGAVSALSTDEQQDALADLAAQLMVVGSERSAPARTLVLTLDRGWPPTSARLSDALTALATLPLVASSSLGSAASAAPTTVTVADKPEEAERTGVVARLSAREAEIASFATVLDDPTILTGEERAEILSLLAVSWRDSASDWNAAVQEHEEQTTDILDSVSITATTQINMVSNQTSLPFSVRNDFDLPVTVVLQASTSSLKLSVDAAVTQTIPANSRETVRVPVQARLGNGDVIVRVQLYSPQNAVIGGSVQVPVSVRADWEGIGAAVIGGLIIALFLGGLIRTIRKRRTTKVEPAPTESGNV